MAVYLEVPTTAPDRARPRRRRRATSTDRVIGQRWFTPYLFLLPGFAFLGTMFLWPAGISIQLSMSDYRIVTPIRFIGTDNFTRLFHDPQFWHALTNSGLFLLMFLPFAVIFPLLLALLVNRSLAGIGFFRAMYYLPVITSMVAVSIAWRYLLDQEGIINWMLSWFGLPGINFLLDTQAALPALVLVEGWKNIGLFMVIYLAGLQGIPRERIEAAMVDGASASRRLRSIIIPSIRPFISITLTMGMLESMRSFESVYILTRGGPQDSTMTIGYYVWHVAFENYDLGYASAAGLVMLVIMIVLAIFNQWATRQK